MTSLQRRFQNSALGRSQPLPAVHPGIVGQQVSGVIFDSMELVGDTSIKSIKAPIDVNQLDAISFNPALSIRLTLLIQGSQKQVMTTAVTDIDNVGIFYLEQPLAISDIIQITGVVNTAFSGPLTPGVNFHFSAKAGR